MNHDELRVKIREALHAEIDKAADEGRLTVKIWPSLGKVDIEIDKVSKTDARLFGAAV